MRIGIEIRHIAEEQNGISPLLQGLFAALCGSALDHQFYFFGTIFNRHLFPDKAGHIHRYSLPLPSYWDGLEALLVCKQIDVLLRFYPVDHFLRFPLKRQVCVISKLPQEVCTSKLSSDQLGTTTDPTLLFEGFGAIGTLSNDVHDNYRDYCDDVFSLSINKEWKTRVRPGTWEKSASLLRLALERVHRRSSYVHIGQAAPTVSIITPSLNQGRFIRRTIDSVLCQTYPHIQYSVIDGGSTDDTLEILRSYGNRVNWTSEPDEGQSNAINKGFKRSTGQILGYLNSDDTLNPQAIETVVRLFSKNPHVDMLYGDANYIDSNDHVVRPYTTDEYSFNQLMQYCCICQPAAFWTSRIAREIGTFNESLHFAMDYDYWLRMGKANALIIHVPVCLANSRIYPETKTTLLGPSAYKEIFDVCLSHGGYVSERWIRGFLRCKPEEQRWLLNLFRSWVGQQNLVEYYILRLGRSQFSVVDAAAKILSLKLRSKFWSKIEKVYRSRAYQKQRFPWGIAGFLPEGYLLSKSRVSLESLIPRRPLTLTGFALVDTHVEIRSAGELILSTSLKADREASLEFVPVSNEVTITFDASRRTKKAQKIAFRLTGTNLFSERELNQFIVPTT